MVDLKLLSLSKNRIRSQSILRATIRHDWTFKFSLMDLMECKSIFGHDPFDQTTLYKNNVFLLHKRKEKSKLSRRQSIHSRLAFFPFTRARLSWKYLHWLNCSSSSSLFINSLPFVLFINISLATTECLTFIFSRAPCWMPGTKEAPPKTQEWARGKKICFDERNNFACDALTLTRVFVWNPGKRWWRWWWAALCHSSESKSCSWLHWGADGKQCCLSKTLLFIYLF